MNEKEEMETLLDRAILRIGMAYVHMSSLIREASCCRAETMKYLDFLREIANCDLLGKEIYYLKQRIIGNYKDKESAIQEMRKEVKKCIDDITLLYKRYLEEIPDGKDLQGDLDKYVTALEAFMDEELKAS